VERGVPLDILVHNAGITRDRQLRAMSDTQWGDVQAVNYEAVLRMNDALGLHAEGGRLAEEPAPGRLCPRRGRVVMVASTSGLAGNRGQTNYAFSKGALIGYAAALGARLRAGWAPLDAGAQGADARGWDRAAAFAVAPGFIETDMTQKMPFLVRQLGRRASALRQGGTPEDVAATVARLCRAGSASVSGQTLRVCGANVVGK
jgi:3-oxoacyl-[acyl-carrier protein] reductase